MDATGSNSVDLERYSARIGYSGPLKLELKALAGLIAHHVAAIPFENIDVLLDRGIDISPVVLFLLILLVEQIIGLYIYPYVF